MTKEEKEIALHCLRATIDEELCEECKLYGTTGIDHCEADVIRMVIKELEKSSSSEIPSSSDNNLSSELEENSKKLENASLFIDWNNCHVSEQFDSIATAGFKHYFTEAWADGFIKVMEQEPNWIPVSERLPEDHKDVLVYLSSDRMSICSYNSHKLPISNEPIGWGYMPGTGYIDFIKEYVIAWMSLPEPYKGESEDKS